MCVCALTNRQAWLQNTSLHRSDFISDENWAFVAVVFVCREYETLSIRRLRMLFLLHANENCVTIYFSIQLEFVSHHLPHDLLHCIVLLHQPFEPRWRIQTQYCKEIFTDIFNMRTPSLALPVLSSCLQERRNLLCRNCPLLISASSAGSLLVRSLIKINFLRDSSPLYRCENCITVCVEKSSFNK